MALDPLFQTLLVLDGIGIPLYSARGASHTLSHISQAVDVERTANGTLIDLSYLPFRKYSYKVSCTDMRAAALDGLFPGKQVTIWSAHPLAYADGGSATRSAVSGSDSFDGSFHYYRPILICLCVAFDSTFAEWAGTYNWNMAFEEV